SLGRIAMQRGRCAATSNSSEVGASMSLARALKVAAMIVTAILTGACSVNTASTLQPASGARATATAESEGYIIGPGDTLQIFVWRNPELSVSVPVRPDGKVSSPLVEDMVAVGKT